MKVLLFLLLALVLISTPASVQAHSATITWTAGIDGGTVNIYRISGTCPASTTTGTGTKLTSTPVTGLTYVDSTVTLGTFCYYATDVLNSSESVPSNLVPAVILPAAPTALRATQTS